MRWSFSKHDLELRRMTMILMLGAFLIQAVDGNVWGRQVGSYYANGYHMTKKEGDYCRINSGKVGVCKRIEGCEIYYEGLRKKTIDYTSLVRCSISKYTEFICCPAVDGVWDYEAINSLEEPDYDCEATNSLEEPIYDYEVINSLEEPDYKAIDSLEKPDGGSFRNPITTRPINKNEKKMKRASEKACDRYKRTIPSSLSLHILGGTKVSVGEYPHMAALIIEDSYNTFKVECAAILISELYVLTAAHCVSDPVNRPSFVRLGVVAWNKVVDDIQPIDLEIENITMHYSYNSFKHFHDIALIRFKVKVTFEFNVFPACLNSDVMDIDSSVPLSVIGWGMTNVLNRSHSDDLLVTSVTTVPLEDCKSIHLQQKKENNKYLNEGQYCAFDPNFNNDACLGDSGGPLQLTDDKPTTIVGVVSYGHSCAVAIPSVYARVAHYLDWIESVVWPS